MTVTQHQERITFSFGENWLAYVSKNLCEERIEMAVNSIKEFAGISDLRGRSFLDLGCGSGLFSLAAYRLGASRITSIDRDPASVEATNRVKRAAGSPPVWSVAEGSVLQHAGQALDMADLVYCWGVVHHTGAMYQAIDNVCRLVAPNGTIYLAVYNRQRLSPVWRAVKRLYNRVPLALQRTLVAAYGALSLARKALSGQNPVAFLRHYSANSRGMSFTRDLADWLGGLPYEYASPEEIVTFVRPLGFELLNMRTVNNHGCNQFLFRRTGF